jgi:hypothetical protein
MTERAGQSMAQMEAGSHHKAGLPSQRQSSGATPPPRCLPRIALAPALDSSFRWNDDVEALPSPVLDHIGTASIGTVNNEFTTLVSSFVRARHVPLRRAVSRHNGALVIRGTHARERQRKE